MDFFILMHKFSRSMNIFTETKPALKSQRVQRNLMPNLHILVAEIPIFSTKVNLEDLLLGDFFKGAFVAEFTRDGELNNAPAAKFPTMPTYLAQYSDRSAQPTEIIVNKMIHRVKRILGAVILI